MKLSKSMGPGIGRSVLGLAASLCAFVSLAQVSAQGFEAKPMQISPISGIGDREVAFINMAMEPGAASPRHTHPGDC